MTLLNDTCRMTHYTQEGVEQLLFQIESARKLIIDINDRYSQYNKNGNISMSLQKLEYAIKTITKKVHVIQEQIKANSGH